MNCDNFAKRPHQSRPPSPDTGSTGLSSPCQSPKLIGTASIARPAVSALTFAVRESIRHRSVNERQTDNQQHAQSNWYIACHRLKTPKLPPDRSTWNRHACHATRTRRGKHVTTMISLVEVRRFRCRDHPAAAQFTVGSCLKHVKQTAEAQWHEPHKPLQRIRFDSLQGRLPTPWLGATGIGANTKHRPNSGRTRRLGLARQFGALISTAWPAPLEGLEGGRPDVCLISGFAGSTVGATGR